MTSNTVLATATWYHLAFVYDDTYISDLRQRRLDNSAAYSSGLGLDGQPIRFAHAEAQTAPSFGTSDAAGSGTGGDIAFAVPASAAAGDLMFAHIVKDRTGPPAPTPSGWALMGISQLSGPERLFVAL